MFFSCFLPGRSIGNLFLKLYVTSHKKPLHHLLMVSDYYVLYREREGKVLISVSLYFIP